jgi:radical SAM superfamily enzyme YgiQ (UPF0313 family)
MKFSPEQVQVFTPTPSTVSTMMYYTEQDIKGNTIFVEKDRNARMKQKLEITQSNNRKASNTIGKKFNSRKNKYGYSKNTKFRKKY